MALSPLPVVLAEPGIPMLLEALPLWSADFDGSVVLGELLDEVWPCAARTTAAQNAIVAINFFLIVLSFVVVVVF